MNTFCENPDVGTNMDAWLTEQTDWTDTVRAEPEIPEPSCDSQEDSPATDPMEHFRWAQSLPMPGTTKPHYG